MKIYTTHVAILIALLFTVSSYAQTEDQKENKDGHPPRPTFESIDTNGDTDIDFEEFSAQKRPNGNPQTIFDLIDTDNNGVISSEEFTNHKPPHPKQHRGKKND